MMTFNDLLHSGCKLQGSVLVVTYDGHGRETVLYKGDGRELTSSEEWGEHCIAYMYPELNGETRLVVELEGE